MSNAEFSNEQELKAIARRNAHIAICCVNDGLAQNAGFYARIAASFANMLLECEAQRWAA